MHIQVFRVQIPAWSTVGYGKGRDSEGRPVRFIGDHRPMRHLGQALAQATAPITVEVEDWQIVEGR